MATFACDFICARLQPIETYLDEVVPDDTGNANCRLKFCLAVADIPSARPCVRRRNSCRGLPADT